MDRETIWAVGTACISFICLLLLLLLYQGRRHRLRQKQWKSQNGERRNEADDNITKCPCGSDKIMPLECAQCHQLVEGCGDCFRRLSPCKCDNKLYPPPIIPDDEPNQAEKGTAKGTYLYHTYPPKVDLHSMSTQSIAPIAKTQNPAVSNSSFYHDQQQRDKHIEYLQKQLAFSMKQTADMTETVRTMKVKDVTNQNGANQKGVNQMTASQQWCPQTLYPQAPYPQAPCVQSACQQSTYLQPTYTQSPYCHAQPAIPELVTSPINQCPGGCNRAQITNCAICHQPAIGCSKCHRHFSPCGCLQSQTIPRCVATQRIPRSDFVEDSDPRIQILQKQLSKSMRYNAALFKNIQKAKIEKDQIVSETLDSVLPKKRKPGGRTKKGAKKRKYICKVCPEMDEVSLTEIQTEEYHNSQWKKRYQQAKERQDDNARLLRQKWFADKTRKMAKNLGCEDHCCSICGHD